MFESVPSIKGVPAAKRLLSLLVSIGLHALVVLLITVLPLVFFQMIPDVEFLTLLIAAPAPPPPPLPPAPAQRATAIKENTQIDVGLLDRIPEQIPVGIPAAWEEPLPVISQATIEGLGVGPGMFGGGLPGASGLESLLHSAAPAPPPPLPPAARTPVLVGGKVQEAKLIRRVPPVYPEIALRARISGLVALEVTVDEEGNVAACRVLQGHPLLVEAAVQAVRQWRYSPTLLNGEPVQVLSTVNVYFVLN